MASAAKKGNAYIARNVALPRQGPWSVSCSARRYSSMRLLNTKDLSLANFSPDRLPPYAILSHTWGEEEVLYEDVKDGNSYKTKAAFAKLQNACQQAKADEIEYIWIDTCCIDKRSSAELQEAINSMYQWYANARICYAYLADVDGIDKVPITIQDHQFGKSRWFARGWTLQELLAPQHVVFFCKTWAKIGEKSELCQRLVEITFISFSVLDDARQIHATSVAERMSWAARRETTRPEDMAYSLMGLFSVTMPMLYGEGGKRAFLRLQEETMRRSNDRSIFAWTDRNASPYVSCGLLATSPSLFAESGVCKSTQDRRRGVEYRTPYSMTNFGLDIEFLVGVIDSHLFAVLNLPLSSEPGVSRNFLAVLIIKVPGTTAEYRRKNPRQLAIVKIANQPTAEGKARLAYGGKTDRGSRELARKRIFVQTSFNDARHDYDNGVFQVLEWPPSSVCGLAKVLTQRKVQYLSTSSFLILDEKQKRSSLPPTYPFRIGYPENACELSAAMIVPIGPTRQTLAILIGTAEDGQPGYDAYLLPPLGEGSDSDSKLLEQLALQFSPVGSDKHILLPAHCVYVKFQSVFFNFTWQHNVAIRIDTLSEEQRPMEVTVEGNPNILSQSSIVLRSSTSPVKRVLEPPRFPSHSSS